MSNLTFRTISSILGSFSCVFQGDPGLVITGPASVYTIKDHEFSFWSGEGFEQVLHSRSPKNLIICRRPLETFQVGNFVFCDDPRLVFMEIATRFFPPRDLDNQVGRNVKIGENCSIKNAVIGDNVEIGPGAIIGQPGFGYDHAVDILPFIKFPHYGRVLIGGGTIIHSNVCIDRGALSDTIIGRNVRIDNLVHIAHNVEIGDNSLIIAGSVIGGGVKIGKN